MKNDINLSISSEPFSDLRRDFDTLLARTVGNMEMKGASDAVITIKVGINLEKTSAFAGGKFHDITKPKFKHDVNSVMQIKDKLTGQYDEDAALVYDKDNDKWIIRKVDNGQVSMFEGDAYVSDEDANVVAMIPQSTGDFEEDEEDEEYASEEDDEILDEADSEYSPFEWFASFVDEEFRVVMHNGVYTVRSIENDVVLSSANAPGSLFYCPADTLEKCVDSTLTCVGFKNEIGALQRIAIVDSETGMSVYEMISPDAEEEGDDYEYEDAEE